MIRWARTWFDLRVLVYGVVLPALIYLTWSISASVRARENAQTTQGLSTGADIAAVFFTTSSCVGNTYPGFRETVKGINLGLDSLGRTQGFIPRRVGVSLDFDIEAGLDILQKFGPFDEISVGNNWVNTAALRYMVVDIPGEAAVPQLVLIRRHTIAEPGKAIAVGSEEVLLRLVGSDQIDAWYRAGMPLVNYTPPESIEEAEGPA